MGTPYFNRDESIIQTAHKVKFDAAVSDVMLTSERLIFIDAGYAQFRPQTISLTTVETVIPGEDAYGNPIVTISLASSTPGGPTQTKDIVFSQKTSGERMQERNDWVKNLKEQIKSVRLKASIPAESLPEQDTDIIFEDEITSETGQLPDSPTLTQISPGPEESVLSAQENTGAEEGTSGKSIPGEPVPGESGAVSETESPKTSPLSSRFHPPGASPGKTNMGAIAAIVIVILAVAGGAFIYSDSFRGLTTGSPETVTTLPMTQPVTTALTPVPTTIVPEPTPATPAITTRATQPPVMIPNSGVWVRIQYAGNYTGQVGVSGGMRQISGIGEKFFQVPTIDGTVQATIQKQDGSGNVLGVELYKNGTLVRRETVAIPWGSVDLHVDLKTG